VVLLAVGTIVEKRKEIINKETIKTINTEQPGNRKSDQIDRMRKSGGPG